MPTASEAVIGHQASYERIYQTVGIRDHDSFYQRVLRLLRPSAGSRLLDVACGEGGLLAASQRWAVAAWGLDISATAVEKARVRHPTAVILVGNAERLPFADGSFDYVTCLGSVENFADPIQALAEMRRVLTVEGLLCVMMPNKFWLGDIVQVLSGGEEQIPFQQVERLATVSQWRHLLGLNGFSVLRVDGYTKTAPLFREGKFRSVRKWVWTHLLATLCPVSLAWSALFVCKKSGGTAPMNPPRGVWLWRAEWVRTAGGCPP